jgi:glycosyltransferase involved in cell wall biosynthesis
LIENFAKESIGMHEYVIISPIRNEEEHIEKTLTSVVLQTKKPKKWLIVDDGSTDKTAEIITRFIKQSTGQHFGTNFSKHDFIEFIKRPQQINEQDVVDRIAKASPPRTFNFGLKYLNESFADLRYDFLVKLDGDLSFGSDYFERLIERFESSPRLGIASGVSSFPQPNGLWTPYVPENHTLGCSKIYRKLCFDGIDGLVEVLGWDTIDEIKAQMMGWETRNFRDIPLVHWRMMGSRTGFARGKIRHGYTNYYLGYHPLYMLARVVRRTADKPFGVSGVLMGIGYLKGWLTRSSRFPDKSFRKFLRQGQVRQLRSLFRMTSNRMKSF